MANLQQVRISNALALRNISALGTATDTPVQGWLLLTGAQLNTILDNVETGWPTQGYLDLEGATYSRIRHVGGGDLVKKNIAWLRRQFPHGRPTKNTFRPQPYEQLSRVMRQHGKAREADAIAVEKIRMRLAARVDKPWSRIFPRMLMMISHHSYSTSRAVASFVIFALLGTIMYASPVIDLGQDQRRRFMPVGPLRWLWLLLNSLYVIAGAAVVVLTLTGVLRRD